MTHVLHHDHTFSDGKIGTFVNNSNVNSAQISLTVSFEMKGKKLIITKSNYVLFMYTFLIVNGIDIMNFL